MNRPLVTLFVLALAAPAAAVDDQHLATADGVALAFTAEQLVGSPGALVVAHGPAAGSLEVQNGGLDFVYTSDPGFVGVDKFRLDKVGASREPGGGDFEVYVSVAPARIPVAGDWNGDGVTETGRYDSDDGELYLYQENVQHPPRFDYTYAGAGPGWRPFAGDFDGDGFDEVGLFDPATGDFHFLLLPPDPVPPPGVNALELYAVAEGVPLASGEVPVAGDWSGDGGADGIGLFVGGQAAVFYLWEDLENGSSSETSFVVLAPGTEPVAGDWDDDGQETVGLYDPATGEFHLVNGHSSGPADEVRRVVGVAGLNRLPLAGDWFSDGDPAATVGLFDPAASSIALYEPDTSLLEAPIVVVIHTDPPCDLTAPEGC